LEKITHCLRNVLTKFKYMAIGAAQRNYQAEKTRDSSPETRLLSPGNRGVQWAVIIVAAYVHQQLANVAASEHFLER